MPMWQLFVPEGAYSPDDQVALADEITKLYTESVGLPRFYVTVLFHEMPKRAFLIGAEPRDNFVRVSVDHIARRFDDIAEHLALPDDTDLAQLWLEQVTAALKPWVTDRGFNWELHVDETPVALWYIDGLVPPPAWSAEEQRWAAENRATPPVAAEEARA